MNKNWKIIKREVALGSPWYKVFRETVQLPSGKVLDDYYVRDGSKAVLVVPYTNDKKFIMVKQYKHGAQRAVLEFPAGKIDAGEDVMAAAKRELREETGAEADKLELGPMFFEDPTNSRTRIFTAFAIGVKHIHQQDLDENEDIDVVYLSRDELQSALTEGHIQVAASVAAGYMALEIINDDKITI